MVHINILNSKTRYLLVVIPFALILGFAVAYMRLSAQIDASLLHEKFAEKQQSIDLLAAQTDAYIDADAIDYEHILAAGMAQIDAQAYTYAALYDAVLDNISARTPSYSSSFEPLEDDTFRDTVMHSESGSYIMPYKPPDDVVRDMHIYYRWIPSDSTSGNRYVAIVAVSQYSVESTLPVGVWVLPIVLCGATTLVITAAVWLLRYLGEIYVSRNGQKWRGNER